MPIKSAVMASGASAQHASALLGIVTACAAITSAGAPAGTNLATAPLVPSDEVILTGSAVASGVGYKLPTGIEVGGMYQLGDSISIWNQGGNTLLVYPATSLGKIQGAGAGAGFSVANNKSALFTYLGTTAGVDLWSANLSA